MKTELLRLPMMTLSSSVSEGDASTSSGSVMGRRCVVEWRRGVGAVSEDDTGGTVSEGDGMDNVQRVETVELT